MQRTKRNRPDFRSAPTRDELESLTSFSYKDVDGLRITFSKTHAGDLNRVAAWNATLCRTTNKNRKTVCVYAGTDRTLPRKFYDTVDAIKQRATERHLLTS